MTGQKTALVTGASRGIGRAIAVQLAKAGCQVAIGYHKNQEDANCLVRELETMGHAAMAVQADVADRTGVEAMVAEVHGRFGPVDILVNNAGIAGQAMFCDVTPMQWDRMFAVNVGGMYHCCQVVLPDMIAKKQGKIINLSSIWGITGASCEVPYSAAKAAVIGFTKALAKELGPSHIQVNCVAPGVIATDMNGALGEETLAQLREETPLGVIGTPEDVAHTVAFLTSKEADFITGQVISPNGGFLI